MQGIPGPRPLIVLNPASVASTDPVADLLRAERSDYRGLYYRWEREQWEAGTIDLEGDASEWRGLSKAARRSVGDAVAWRHLRARQATTALVPFVDIAPNEEQQVFLTTELVDEARHVVLFDRFATEVMGQDATTVAERAPDVGDPVLRELLLADLPEMSARLAAADALDLGLLVEGVTLYQLGILGLLDLTEQRWLVVHLESEGSLRGLREGLALARRDAARHVAFALRLLEEASAIDAAVTASARAALEDLYPRVAQVLRRTGLPEKTGVGNDEMNQAAQGSCAAWFEAVGLEPPRLG